MPSTADIRDIVAAETGVEPHLIGDDDDLVSLGMHSMKLMHLAARWRKQGYDVRSSNFALEPTISAWARLLDAADPGGADSAAAPGQPAESAENGDEFGLATMQHAYWVGRRQDQALGGVAAHLYVEFDGAGADGDRLAQAVRALVQRHEQLRVQFTDAGTQRVLLEPLRPVFHLIDLMDRDTDSVDSELARIRREKSHQRLDVAAGQVLDITCTLLPADRHRLHVDVDMLAADALSYRHILDDLARLYEAQPAATPDPLGYTFRTYLASKNAEAQNNTTAKAWWADRLEVMPETPSLPVLPEAQRQDPAASIRLHHWFTPEAKAQLYRAAHARGVTPVIALATAFTEAIARWSKEQRFLLNVPLFDREPLDDRVEQVVGDFTNSVLVDVDATRSESTIERARRLQRELHTSAQYSTYAGLDVLRDLGRVRGAPVTPSVVFTSGLGLGELFSERVTRAFGKPVWIISQGPQVDLDAQAAEIDGGLLVNWDVRRDAMPPGVVTAMFEAFRNCLLSLAAPEFDWDAPLRIPLPAPQRAVRDAVNSTALDLGARTLHEEFFARAEREPDRVASLSRESKATYGELAEQAWRVAGALADAGVRPGDSVAVIVPKGLRQLPAVLGVLAAGATYVPVGVGQPTARRNRILRRADAVAAIVDGDLDDALPAQVSPVELTSALSNAPLNKPVVTDPNAVAYVLFTSGSTGEPKGVEVSHRAAANTIDALVRHFDIDGHDRHIGLSALDFDLSVFDIFCPLSVGGALACVDTGTERDAEAWSELIAAAGVTVINCAPGLIGMLLDTATPAQLSSVRVVITGGDRVKTSLAQRFRTMVPGLRFAGLGGTTETAIHSTVCEVTDEFAAEYANVPYGTPLSNVLLRVVNTRGEDCPDWVVGELWIGGDSVAAGYRGDPERTAERFVTVDGVRWYRTGDMARYLPDGSVDFLGRADHQVKIRGFRVELGEIEAALCALPQVTEAVALVTDAGRLVAAVVGPEEIDAEPLRKLLPAHMIPDTLDVLASIPLTGNGKLDRAALRARLDHAGSGTVTSVAPASDLEAAVAYIAAQVLSVEEIGVETDFFEAGGDSILATTLTAKVRGLLAVENFGVTEVFDARTVRRICTGLLVNEVAPQRLARAAAILLELVGE